MWKGCEVEMIQRVEFIESYIKIGNGDYQWNDNHGELIRCKDCRHNYDCSIQYHAQAGEEFYCGAAERRTDEGSD